MFWDWNHNGKYDAFDEFMEAEIADDIDRELSKPIDPYDYIDDDFDKDFDADDNFDDDDFDDSYDDDSYDADFESDDYEDTDNEEPDYRDAFRLLREDFPNERTYFAAFILEEISEGSSLYDSKDIERCNFILDGECLAAKYLNTNGYFLYAQAAKEHFDLPIQFPDEDYDVQTDFPTLIRKLAWQDERLSFEVWEWCYDVFYKYRKYTESYNRNDLTSYIINSMYNMPKDYIKKLLKYIDGNPDFSRKIIAESDELCHDVYEFVCEAIGSGMKHTAVNIFKDAIICAKNEPEELYYFIESIYDYCKDWDELERLDFFIEELLPLLEKVENKRIWEYAQQWKKDGAEYIHETEMYNDKYAYTRGNSWRNDVSEEDAALVAPTSCYTQKEYINALRVKKYEYSQQHDALKADVQNEPEPQHEPLHEPKIPIVLSKETLQSHLYCGVMLQNRHTVYSYRAADDIYEIGDKVCVPVGSYGKEMVGTVVYVGRYSQVALPYPLEETKFIIGKCDED